MTITYCVNIWTHYQDAFCREMVKLHGDSFKLVLFRPQSELKEFDGSNGPKNDSGHRQPWVCPAPDEAWIVRPPQKRDDLRDGIWNKLLADSDVAIVGYCDGMSRAALQKRRRLGKPTFFMGERYFKTAWNWRSWLVARNLIRWVRLHCLLRGRNAHYLEISHAGKDDLRVLRVCKGRIFAWSYFPKVSNSYQQKTRREKLRIGWCGRMIPWKHVEYIVKAVGLLPEHYRNRCDVTIVGEGECKKGLIDLAAELGVSGIVKFETYKPMQEAMRFMRDLDLYLFPSDRGEGWGVALMEAMDKGCVPIANVDAGSTLELVRDGVNGFTFEDGDVARIAKCIEWCVDHPGELERLSRAAWESMVQWSPAAGAQVLSMLIHTAQTGDRSRVPANGLGRLIG